jgi:hypothetical protein
MVFDEELVAVVLVKDEEERLPRSIPPLVDACDRVVVADTGSQDDSVRVAAALGAEVVTIPWTGSFAAARNAAATAVVTEGRRTMILAVDADEALVADGDALRRVLADVPTDHAVHVLVRNLVDTSQGRQPWDHRAARGYDPRRLDFAGSAHEQLVTKAGNIAPALQLPESVAYLEHLGYYDTTADGRKGLRNASLLAVELSELPGDAPASQRAQLLLDLGRSLVAAGDRQSALETLELARTLASGTSLVALVDDVLARLLLGAGELDLVLSLAQGLRAHGVQEAYCDHLAGQALVMGGRVEEGVAALLRASSAGQLVDAAGRRWEAGETYRWLGLGYALAGQQQDAVKALRRAAEDGVDVAKDLELIGA